MDEYEYKHWCGNCQIRIYVQRHYGRILTWQDCPYTCEYTTAMRCSTEAKGRRTDDAPSAQPTVLNAKKLCKFWDSESNFCTLHRPSAQPELIERTAYIRGFEQGRTQGMIDAQGGKNMIKAEWTNADALNLQPTCNQLATDCISRQAAIDDFYKYPNVKWTTLDVLEHINALPSAQPERDIPMKPNETIDSSWGIRKKQAVCPKCDYYLGHVEFIGNPNGKKVTYCETCGQAIDWEGWEWEEE